MKKKIEIQSITTNEQNNPYRIQLAELCKDIVEEKRLELNPEDERLYRLLSIDILSPMKTLSTNLNEFVSLYKNKNLKFFYDCFILLVK